MFEVIEADRLISRGHKALEKGDSQQAISLFRKALRRNPKAIQAYIHIARSHARSKCFPRAEEMAKKALEFDPLNPSYHLYLGQIYYDTGRYGDAYDEFDHVIREQEDNQLAYGYLALSLYNLGERQRAIDLFREKGVSNNVEFLCRFCTLFEQEMMEHPERFPRPSEEHLQMGASLSYRIYSKLKHIVLLGRLARSVFVRRALRKASNYLDFGNAKVALDIFTWLRDLEPYLIEAEFGRGLALIELKRYESAKRTFMTLSESDPNNSLFVVYLGICDFHLKDYTSAISLLKNAPVEGPQDYNAYYYLGLSYLAIGETGKVNEAFKTAFTKYYIDTFEDVLKDLIQRITSSRVK